MTVQWQNARFDGNGALTVEINHPVRGWCRIAPISFDESAPFDVAGLMAEIEAAGIKPPQTTQITFAQLLIGLVAEEWITEAEGEAWLTGTPPAPVLALIAQLPQGQRFAAKARAIRPSIVLRSDPLVIALGTMQGKTPAQLDAFFNTYGAA